MQFLRGHSPFHREIGIFQNSLRAKDEKRRIPGNLSAYREI
jgi:hypothetical protein